MPVHRVWTAYDGRRLVPGMPPGRAGTRDRTRRLVGARMRRRVVAPAADRHAGDVRFGRSSFPPVPRCPDVGAASIVATSATTSRKLMRGDGNNRGSARPTRVDVDCAPSRRVEWTPPTRRGIVGGFGDGFPSIPADSPGFRRVSGRSGRGSGRRGLTRGAPDSYRRPVTVPSVGRCRMLAMNSLAVRLENFQCSGQVPARVLAGRRSPGCAAAHVRLAKTLWVGGPAEPLPPLEPSRPRS